VIDLQVDALTWFISSTD